MNHREPGRVDRPSVPRYHVLQLSVNPIHPLPVHVPSNLRTMVVFVLSSQKRAGNWLVLDKLSVKVAVDGVKSHLRPSWSSAVIWVILRTVLLAAVLAQLMDQCVSTSVTWVTCQLA